MSELRVGFRISAIKTGRPDYKMGDHLRIDYGPGEQQRFTGFLVDKDEGTMTLEDRVGNRAIVRWPHLSYVTLLDRQDSASQEQACLDEYVRNPRKCRSDGMDVLARAVSIANRKKEPDDEEKAGGSSP